MNTQEEFNRLHSRFDKVEEKLDSHLDRLSRAEEAIQWLKGHVNLVTAVGLALVGTLITLYFK